MLGNLFTFPELLILIPLVFGILIFLFGRNGGVAKTLAFIGSLLVLAASLWSLMYPGKVEYNAVSYLWMKHIGASYTLKLDGVGRILTFLTALTYPAILASSFSNRIDRDKSFYGLMLLAQAGMMGVFCAFDALTFYFFWELALIPVYFLSSIWGGEKRIQATFKFFVYTFAGSLLMLIGIIYVYMHTSPHVFEDGSSSAHSFSYQAFRNALFSLKDGHWLFWLFFAAFAIKMPVFPFHTWQPDAYDQSPTPVTAVLSGLMVKMGVFGVIRWLIPVFPEASVRYADIVMWLSIFGIIYASIIALRQDNIKRLVAYSSIAHIGLMCAAIFSMTKLGVQGALIQMFNHGLNIVAMWIIVNAIERKTGTKKLSQLSGLAHKAPVLTILAVITAFANIALPLTNAFIGEFMMLGGLWKYKMWMAGIAGVAVILAAAYTLRMVQKVFYGPVNPFTENVTDIDANEKVALTTLAAWMLVTGVLPQGLIDMTAEAAKLLGH